MDAWIKAKAGELAQAAQQIDAAKYVNDLQQSATQLTAELSESLNIDSILNIDHIATTEGCKDVEFEEGQMGFQMDGMVVVSVHPDKQAAKLGVEVGDRLVKIAGYPIPEYELGDAEGAKRAEKEARRMMKEMPPPVRLTFQQPTLEAGGATSWAEEGDLDVDLSEGEEEPPIETTADASGDASRSQPAENAASASTDPAAPEPATPEPAMQHPDGPEPETPEVAPAVASDTPTVASGTPAVASGTPAAASGTPAVASGTPAEVSSQVKALQEKLQSERDKKQRFAAELREARQTRAIMIGSLEAEKRQVAEKQGKIAELSDEVTALKTRNKELLDAATRSETDGDSAREAFEQREKALQDQLGIMNKTLEQEKVAGNASIEAAGEAAKQRAAVAEEATARAQAQQAALEVTVGELESAITSQAKEIEEWRTKCDAAEAHATAADRQIATLKHQLGGFDTAHDTELELFKEEEARLKQAVQRLEEQNQKIAEQEQNASSQLMQAQQELQELRSSVKLHLESAEASAVELQAAGVEAMAARKAAAEAQERAAQAEERAAQASVPTTQSSATLEDDAVVDESEAGSEIPITVELNDASPTSPGTDGEISRLHARIDLLQQRCSTLQKKLIEQRTIGSNLDGAAIAGGGQRIPVFLPLVIRVAGPRAGQLAVLLYGRVDGTLRGFTQRLLKRDMWLFIFYAHLVVLYTITASCMAHITPDPNAPLAAINAHISKSKTR